VSEFRYETFEVIEGELVLIMVVVQIHLQVIARKFRKFTRYNFGGYASINWNPMKT
jgi:iron complex outermembrane receptor protein